MPPDQSQELPKKKRKKKKAPRGPAPAEGLASRLPAVTPHTRCRLRLLRHERIKDYLLIEQELVQSHESLFSADQLQASQSDKHKRMEQLRGHPIHVATLEELLDDGHAIVSSHGSELYVDIMSFVDRTMLEPGCTVLCRKTTSTIVGVLASSSDSSINIIRVDQAPEETYADIGGLEEQIQEIKEAVELPLTRPELYDEIGITAPKGVILYGEPGTGKTLLARAVANATSATFLYVVGSELVQKYLGEGPKLVRQLFSTARELSPSIIFIDEVDAVGTKRYANASSGGEREVERTMLELLNQLDGFDGLGEVKIIMATNRIESLDPALIRPGRIDRKIHFTLPDAATKRRIFEIHSKRMTLDPDVYFPEFIHDKDELTGADIKAICMEAGIVALRERRMRVTQSDFLAAKEQVLHKKQQQLPPGMYV